MLVAILAERDSQAAALMQEQGMTRYDLTRYISHGIAKKGWGFALAGRPGRAQTTYRVGQVLGIGKSAAPERLLHAIELVVHVLERVFDKDRETATRIMLEIHNKGTATCGIYPYDAADAKVREVLALARAHQYPLQCVLDGGDA